MTWRAGLTILIASMAGAAAAQPAVELRPVIGAAAQIVVDGDAVDASTAGVMVKSGGGGGVAGEGGAAESRTLVGWQRVRAVNGPLKASAARFDPQADALWRIEQRIGRADYALAEKVAEPMYERALAEGGDGLHGPSGAMLAEAVMRCRLARGFTTGAVVAYLDLAATVTGKAEGVRWVGWEPQGIATNDPRWSGVPAMDDAMPLCPWLPPAFSSLLSGRAVQAFGEGPHWARFAKSGGPVAELAALYRYAATAEASVSAVGDGAVPGMPQTKSDDRAVALVRMIVVSRMGTPEERHLARRQLELRISEEFRFAAMLAAGGSEDADGQVATEEPRWVEAWCRLAIGRSLLRETDPALRREGLVELLHLPARFAQTLPTLCAVALAESAAELERTGDATGAEALRLELRSLHPVLAAGLSVEGAGH